MRMPYTNQQTYFPLLGIAFVLNFIWENLHAALYTNIDPIIQAIPYYTLSTIGDVIIIICLYLLLSWINRDTNWIKHINVFNISICLLSGMLTAVSIELTALHYNLWHYTTSMPLVPLTHVGLSPVLQLMLLPLASYYLYRKYIVLK